MCADRAMGWGYELEMAALILQVIDYKLQTYV